MKISKEELELSSVGLVATPRRALGLTRLPAGSSTAIELRMVMGLVCFTPLGSVSDVVSETASALLSLVADECLLAIVEYDTIKGALILRRLRDERTAEEYIISTCRYVYPEYRDQGLEERLLEASGELADGIIVDTIPDLEAINRMGFVYDNDDKYAVYWKDKNFAEGQVAASTSSTRIKAETVMAARALVKQEHLDLYRICETVKFDRPRLFEVTP